MPIRYLPVSWTTYQELTQKLATKILNNPDHPQEIVAISRGGLTLGHLLSDLLRIPISTITIQSYTDIQRQGEIKITHGLQADISRKYILLVDDVSDSGKTLNRAVEYLHDFNPEKIATATLFFKPHSIHKPDYFVKETTDWILFPYEPTEMIGLLTKKFQAEGRSDPEIGAFLKSLGFTGNQIDFTHKYFPA